MWMWPNYVDLLQQAAVVDLQKNAELAQRRIQVQINSISHAFLPLARYAALDDTENDSKKEVEIQKVNRW
jgi:hypothetical protein